MTAVPVGVPEMTFPVTVRPAGNPRTHTVAPTDGVSVATNGSPVVPDNVELTIVGSGHGSMVMVVVADAPQSAVAVIVAVPAANGVPEMTLPVRTRPDGSPVAVIVVPTGAVIVDRNGSPTVPMSVSGMTAGVSQEPMVIVVVATAPHGEVTVRVIVPLAVGVPEITLQLRVRPAGNEAAVTVATAE